VRRTSAAAGIVSARTNGNIGTSRGRIEKAYLHLSED
jgi:hypothetical protein